MPTDNARALAMFQVALEMEEKGKAFYDKAIATCTNPVGREIFVTLMRDEIVHIERIERISASVGGGGWTESWKEAGEGHADLAPFFQELARKAGPDIRSQASDLEALDVGINFEQRSVMFYQEELSRATEAQECAFAQKMMAEEQSHFDVLTDMKFYLSDPAAYFSEKERAHYDGA